MFGHERQRVAERLTLGPPHGQLGAELRLPAGSFEEEHQPARDRESELAAVVLLHQRDFLRRALGLRGDEYGAG